MLCETTIQHFMWGDSSDLSPENSKGSGSGSLHVRNQVTLSDEKFVCLRSNMLTQYVRCRLPHTYILYFECIKTTSGKRKKKEEED